MNKNVTLTLNEKHAYMTMFLPGFLVLLVLAIIPVASIFLTSTLNWEIASLDTPKWVGFKNIINLLSDKRYLGSIKIQFIMSFCSVALQLLLGLIFALLFHRASKTVMFLRNIVVISYVMPPVVVALIWLTLFTPAISPINSFMQLIGLPSPSWLTVGWLAALALIIADVWHTFPFSTLIILAALQNVPLELYEAADVDGASRRQVNIFITLPMVNWAIIFCSTIRIIESFKSFPLIYIMTAGGPGTSTQVTNFYAYLNAFQYGHIGYASAISLSIFVLTALLSLIILRTYHEVLYR